MMFSKIHASLMSALLALLFPIVSMNPSPGSWLHPITSDTEVIRHFDPPEKKWSAGHRGVDFSPPSESVQAPSSGVVHFVGIVVDRPVISIDHGQGYLSSYEPVITELSKGDLVSAGDVIGTLGEYSNEPHCPVNCLHFGVRLDGNYINPLHLLADYRPSILLPMGGF